MQAFKRQEHFFPPLAFCADASRLLRLPGLAPCPEEPPQQLGAFISQDPAFHLRPPVARRLAEVMRAVLNRASLRIRGAVDEPTNAGMADRAGAHGAWLQGDEEAQPR